MRILSTALICATIALAPAGCAQRETAATTDAPETTFEVTPPVAIATGATAIVGLGLMAIIACGIICVQ